MDQPKSHRLSLTDPSDDLSTVPQAAKMWQRSSTDLYAEIEDHDYREEQGVFFRHLDKRCWRINRFLYLYWRRMPLAMSGDARTKEFSDFLLLHIEPAITALLALRRYLYAEREAAAVRIETYETKQDATNHAEPGVKP